MVKTDAETLLEKVQFLNRSSGVTFQVLPLSDGLYFIAKVTGFKEFEYSFEGAVPFSGDPRLAFNKQVALPAGTSPIGFRLIGKEFNRIARLSGTADPQVIETFRTRLNSQGELLTFLTPVYADNGRVVPACSLPGLRPCEEVPDEACLAIIEVVCERDFDYIPSRTTHLFFYYPERIRVVSHLVSSGPPLDCPGEEWEAKAYEGSLRSNLEEFFACNDAAVSIELATKPSAFLQAVIGNLGLPRAALSEEKIKFSPVMVANPNAKYAFSPPNIPDRTDTSHLREFKMCLTILHKTILKAIESRCREEPAVARKQGSQLLKVRRTRE